MGAEAFFRVLKNVYLGKVRASLVKVIDLLDKDIIPE